MVTIAQQPTLGLALLRLSPCWYHEANSNAVGMQGWAMCVSVPTTQRTTTKNKLK
ncbi:hypothetical protein [Ferruginibacter sp.]|nr:hypothetical protein [Ferruginibacter sp.]